MKYKLKKEEDGSCIIDGDWIGPSASFHCEIEKNEMMDNSSDRFLLEIDGGQVTKGKIEMIGSWERHDLIETLELILRELKN